METAILASLLFLALIALAAILNTQRKILNALKNIRIPEPQKIELPKVEIPEFPKFPKFPEFPKIEIPPAKEISLDLNPVIEAINNIRLPSTITAELLQGMANAQNDLIKALQETSALMRVNQAEFQSGLEAFHKAADKLLAQIPNGEKELDTQREFMQKFEDAIARVQEKASEAMNENSLRLQEILAEFLGKEAK